ncbi:carcinoembryonic antigen-related cell adhesion molecule 4-like [Sceloporus undulatus]|uniref:carcinoembryonic antigen-related cell adhesion molecule 4-like n=1 Tax=Sceloporus undulatus TaxID=8520 RepID=UPI001C4CCA18|nr:carcinoembryonic antigen-related cell adhesion molecule 4-like [Sceloporus undulatus]
MGGEKLDSTGGRGTRASLLGTRRPPRRSVGKVLPFLRVEGASCGQWAHHALFLGMAGHGRAWQMLPLIAFLLSSCLQLSQSHGGHEIGVTLDPPEPVAGQNITLTPGGYLEGIGICFWLRGGGDEEHRILTYFPPPVFVQEDGPANTGRETAGKDCSLHIRELKAADTGNYTILKNKLRGSGDPQKGHVYLFVPENTGNPETKKVDGVPSGFIAGTAAGSFLGLMFSGSLVYYGLFSVSSLWC